MVIHEGDILLFEDIKFKVIKTNPSLRCKVTSDTKIYCEEPIQTNIVPVSQVCSVRENSMKLMVTVGKLMQKLTDEQKEREEEKKKYEEEKKELRGRLFLLEYRVQKLEKTMNTFLVSAKKFAAASEQTIALFKTEIKKAEESLNSN